ncbi:MAG: hypothetical protein ACI4SY_06365 [Sutterella sp.]
MFALMAVFPAVPAHASPAAVSAAAAQTSVARPPAFCVPGCAACYEPVYPLYERQDTDLRGFPDGLKGWRSEYLRTPVGTVIILTRDAGKVRRLYEFVADGEKKAFYFLLSEGESPHNLP